MDTEKFEKILNNLILNAFKHTGIDGEITLEISNEKEMFNFAVSDNGEGIHPEDLPYIFDRYYQSQQKSISASGGTGIGLTLALEYSKLFGGNIIVDSTYGNGSKFTIRIPLQVMDNAHEEATEINVETADKQNAHSVNAPDNDITKPDILIVDDDMEISQYLVDNLSAKYNCFSAPDGFEAINLLKKYRFDLIISDVMMPNMDGFEFRKEVRANNLWKQYPFMMLTARTLEEDKITGFKLGVDDYIIKPFNLNELKARIENLIHNKLERDNWWRENAQEGESKEVITFEEQMLLKAEEFVLENLSNPKLKASYLASHLGYSQRQLERLLKKSSGFTPSAFIREIRLKRAYRIIDQRQFSTIKEVCYDVGINSPASFSTIFKERFGKSPSEV
jgi:DNA-binding response OmpR family regulator